MPWSLYWEPGAVGQVEHSESETLWNQTILSAGMALKMSQISHVQFEHSEEQFKYKEQQDNDLD